MANEKFIKTRYNTGSKMCECHVTFIQGLVCVIQSGSARETVYYYVYYVCIISMLCTFPLIVGSIAHVNVNAYAGMIIDTSNVSKVFFFVKHLFIYIFENVSYTFNVNAYIFCSKDVVWAGQLSALLLSSF